MQQTQTRCQTVTDHPESNESLCVRVQQGDAQAKLQLLKQNEGMIHTIAWRERRRYAYLSLELEDLWAAGQMGLLRAARLYRPETGNRFATYAWSHIRQAVQREIICGGTIVRIPVHLHDRMHKLSVYREPGTAVSYDALSRRVAAEEKNGKTINETEIKEILCKVEPMVSLRSLNETMKLDGETERQEMVTDPEIPTPDEEVGDHLFLASCLEQLTPRERQVIAMRYGLENCERMTLMEIGGKLHITKERVRQLEQRAMEKMRAFSRS